MTASASPIRRAFSGVRFERGGSHAYYHIADDCIRVPDQTSFFEPINFYRTALHELSHNAVIRFMPRAIENVRLAA